MNHPLLRSPGSCRPALTFRLLALAFVAGISLPFAAGGDNLIPTPNYVVFPVTTDLQAALASREARLFVLLDGTDALADGTVSLKPLGLEQLEKDLLKHKKGRPNLEFNVFYKRSDVDQREAQKLLRYALIGFGHDLGFAKVRAFGQHSNTDITWIQFVKQFRGKVGPNAETAEPAKGNAAVTVYPVRTELSRYLTGGADCVVMVLSPLNDAGGVLPVEVGKSAQDLVGKLKLEQKGRVTFYAPLLGLPEEETQRLLAEFDQLGRTLGFAGNTVTTR